MMTVSTSSILNSVGMLSISNGHVYNGMKDEDVISLQRTIRLIIFLRSKIVVTTGTGTGSDYDVFRSSRFCFLFASLNLFRKKYILLLQMSIIGMIIIRRRKRVSTRNLGERKHSY